MDPVDASEVLSSIRLVAVLSVPVEAVVGEIRERLAERGVQMFVRADGYAIAREEAVARAGLPHLRLFVSRGTLSMWVRSPGSLREDLLSGLGYTVDSLVREILGSAAVVEETIRGTNPEFLESSVPRR